MKKGMILFFLGLGLTGVGWSEEAPKAEYVWAEPADEAAADTPESSQTDGELRGFAVKPVS